jgi:hypothetical protein
MQTGHCILQGIISKKKPLDSVEVAVKTILMVLLIETQTQRNSSERRKYTRVGFRITK